MHKLCSVVYASILSVIYLGVTQTELIIGQIDKPNDYFGGLFVFVNAHQLLGAHDFVAVFGGFNGSFKWFVLIVRCFSGFQQTVRLVVHSA